MTPSRPRRQHYAFNTTHHTSNPWEQQEGQLRNLNMFPGVGVIDCFASFDPILRVFIARFRPAPPVSALSLFFRLALRTASGPQKNLV